MSASPTKFWSLDPLERLNLTFSAGAVAVSALVATPAFALSCALGAGLEAVNFRALRASAAQLLSGQLQGAPAWVALLGMRLSMLLVSMAVALGAGAHPIGLLLGVSMVVPAVLVGAWIWRPAVDPNAPALAPDDPEWEAWDAWRAAPRAVREDDEAQP
jgi:hypothetical protein